MHWTERSRIANEYHTLVLPFRNKFTIKKFPVSIDYEFKFKGRLLDTTNLASMCKFLEDGLRGINLLPDDNPKYVYRTCMSSEKGDTDEVTITIKSKGTRKSSLESGD